MGFFGIVRTENGVGVTNPCQIKYIRYYEQLVKRQFLGLTESEISSTPGVPDVPLVERKLNKVRLAACKDLAFRPASVALYKCGRRIFHSKETGKGPFVSKEQDKEFLDFWCEKTVSGDVKVEFLDEVKGETLFSFWFHVTFVSGNSQRVPRKEIDGAHKDKHKAKVGEDFSAHLVFDPDHRVFLSAEVPLSL